MFRFPALGAVLSWGCLDGNGASNLLLTIIALDGQMNRQMHDSRAQRLQRLEHVRALLREEAAIRPPMPPGWLAWTGAALAVFAALVLFSSLTPQKATASSKVTPAITWPASFARPARPVPEKPSAAPVHLAPPMIALVIDDIGPAQRWSQGALALPAAVTLAILPFEGDAPAWTKRAQARGHAVLLHMPMEPRGLENPGPGALLKVLSPARNQARLAAALARIPGAIGVNNHMGSRFTSCAPCVGEVAPLLRKKGLFFLDSLTSPSSAAAREIAKAGVPVIRRDVFLDDENAPAAIARQMQRAEALARRQGVAVVIAHPRPLTMQALTPWLQRLRAGGIELVPLQTAMARRAALKRDALLHSARL